MKFGCILYSCSGEEVVQRFSVPIYSNGGHIGWLFDTILTNLKGPNGKMLDAKYHPI